MRILVTGATRGLGLATATALASSGVDVIVNGRTPATVNRVAADIGATPLVFDLTDLQQVQAIGEEMEVPDVVIANAGLQFSGAPGFTPVGVETTHAANVLGHVVLIETLLARERRPARIILLSSGTHDPAQHTGVPRPDESLDIEAIAGGSIASGMRRYSTSKLHATALAPAWARVNPDVHWTAFDPGLMLGTGLARDHGRLTRGIMRAVGPALRLLPFASTVGRSSQALARLALDEPAPFISGEVVSYRFQAAARSKTAADPQYQDALLAALRAQARDYTVGTDTSSDPSKTP